MPSSCITPNTGPVRPAAVTRLAISLFIAAAIAFIALRVYWNGSSPVLYTYSLAVLVIYATVTGIGLMRLNPAAYKWAFIAPFMSIPLWKFSGMVIAPFVEIYTSGLEGSHTNTPSDLFIYCVITAVILLPFWLMISVPYWAALRKPELKETFILSVRHQNVLGRTHFTTVQMVLLLLSVAILPFLRVGDGRMLLHDAAAHGWTPIVKPLIFLGQDVNDPTKDGWMPLHYAACYGRVETVNYLLAKGAKVNTKADEGITPVVATVIGNTRSWGESHFVDPSSNNKATLRLLAESGANLTTRTYRNKSILTIILTMARFPYDPKLVYFLIDHGAPVDPDAMRTVIQQNDLSGIKLMIARGAKLTPDMVKNAQSKQMREYLRSE